jgi:transposase
MGPARCEASRQSSARTLEDDDLCGGAPPRSNCGSVASRWTDRRRHFHNYVEKVLLPTLNPGDVVVMDNLGSHKGKAVRRLICSVGAKLFFRPKYSPDLNPIEQVFAKLKHLLGKAAARTVEAICAAVGQILGSFTSEECADYFKNAGYASI